MPSASPDSFTGGPCLKLSYETAEESAFTPGSSSGTMRNISCHIAVQLVSLLRCLRLLERSTGRHRDASHDVFSKSLALQLISEGEGLQMSIYLSLKGVLVAIAKARRRHQSGV